MKFRRAEEWEMSLEKWGRIQVTDSLSFNSITRIIRNFWILERKAIWLYFRLKIGSCRVENKLERKKKNRVISCVLQLWQALPSFRDHINTIVFGKPFFTSWTLIDHFLPSKLPSSIFFYSDNVPLIHNLTTRLLSERRKAEERISHLSFQAWLQERLTSYSCLAGWISRKILRLSLVCREYLWN